LHESVPELRKNPASIQSRRARVVNFEQHANAEGARKLRILVVDDNRDGAVMLAALLELAGHRTRTAENGLQAIDEAAREHFDAVLLDLGMPVMDGFEAAAVLSELRPAPALIACSAWDDPETRRRTTDLGFSAHLRKPVPLELLEATLLEVMAGRART
jgi:CheY-like chemotaxis protein